jgi:ElaB/YqjD/DUF883 family membrane-anchored ribosome-binding protein
MPMADPKYPNAMPSASDHPGVPRPNAERELPERATPNPIGHIPVDEPERNPRLNSAAETVGRTLGTAVSGARSTKERFTVIRGGAERGAKAKVNEAMDQVREKGEELVDKARQSGEELVDKAREKSSELAEQARTKGQEIKEQAQIRFEQARARAEYLAHHDPIRVIGAAAVMGVVLGIFLRLWRDHHAG